MKAVRISPTRPTITDARRLSRNASTKAPVQNANSTAIILVVEGIQASGGDPFETEEGKATACGQHVHFCPFLVSLGALW